MRARIPNPKAVKGVTVTIKIVIPESHIAGAIEMMHAWYGFVLTRAQLITMARKNSALARDLADLPADTETRETIAWETAKFVTGQRWPIYGDGPRAWTRFAKQFNELAPKAGIRLERLLDVSPPKPKPRRMSRCGNAVPSPRKRKAA